MSNANGGPTENETVDTALETGPRALIHRKILDVAKKRPNASTDEIAEQVSGASATFVSRVLEEHGDPAHGNGDRNRTNGESTGPEHDSPTDSSGDATDGHTTDAPLDRSDDAADPDANAPDDEHEETTADDVPVEVEPSALSEKVRETLIAVAHDPEATQAEIADRLGVSRATVSKRLTDVEGFHWDARQEFVETLFDHRGEPAGDGPSGESGSEESSVEPSADGSSGERGTTDIRDATDGSRDSGDGDPSVDVEARLDAIEARIDGIEGHLDESVETGSTRDDTSGSTGTADPELVRTAVRACIDADYVSEAQERRILAHLLDAGDA